ncbi:MAG: hypothetical protein V1726_03415 [Methanobacteriota archaeon]
MKNKKKYQKQSSVLFHHRRPLYTESKSQMIVLMGVTLALCVFIISAIPSDITDYTIAVPKGRSDSLLLEFIHIRELYGTALNCHLAKMEFRTDSPDILLNGKNGKYTWYFQTSSAFQDIRNDIYQMELPYGRYFTASMKNEDMRALYSHISPEGTVYYVDAKLSLRDEYGSISQTVRYTLLFNEQL